MHQQTSITKWRYACLLIAALAATGCARVVTQAEVAEFSRQQTPYGGSFPSPRAGWWYMGSDAQWHYLAWVQYRYVGGPTTEYRKMDKSALSLRETVYSEDQSTWVRLTWSESGLTSR